jgi:hypothetical protein
MTRFCFAHNHMTPKEFGVYQYALAVSHTSGKFFFDGRGTASQFAGTKKDAVYPIASRLEKMGWFVVLKASERNELGMWTPTEYQVLNHEDWQKTHGGQCRKPVAEPRQAPVGKLRQAPVAESQLTCLDSSTDVSANSNSRVAEPRHKYVKRIQKREESERKDCAAPVPESGQAQPANQSLSPSLDSCEKPSTEKLSPEEEQLKAKRLAEQREWIIARDKRVRSAMDEIEIVAHRYHGHDKEGNELPDPPSFSQKGKDLIRQALLKIENGRYTEDLYDGWPDGDIHERGIEICVEGGLIEAIVKQKVESSDAFQLKNFSTNLGLSLYGAVQQEIKA